MCKMFFFLKMWNYLFRFICSCNVVIQGFLWHQDASRAAQLNHEMVDGRFSPDATTTILVINLLSNDDGNHILKKQLRLLEYNYDAKVMWIFHIQCYCDGYNKLYAVLSCYKWIFINFVWTFEGKNNLIIVLRRLHVQYFLIFSSYNVKGFNLD